MLDLRSNPLSKLTPAKGHSRPRLTNREREVMDRLAKGLLYKEIADELGIAFSTVNKHQHNIFLKLHVSNRTEAVMKWARFRS